MLPEKSWPKRGHSSFYRPGPLTKAAMWPVLEPWAAINAQLRLMVDKGSMFNTPNTLESCLELLAWLQGVSGVSAIANINQQKADVLRRAGFQRIWVPQPQRTAASMNVTRESTSRPLISIH